MADNTVQDAARDQLSKTLYHNLGTFWSRIYGDRNLVYRLCQGDSINAAQTYLNLLEAIACLSYNTIPTFHRERWFPVVIRQSERNNGEGVKVAVNMPQLGYIGGQPADSPYPAGSEFMVGGPALPEGYISYPIRSGALVGGVEALLSSIVDPKATYTASDFYIQGDSLVIKEALDPFLFPDSFPQLVVQGADSPDAEIVLWGTNALSDVNYVADMFGYMQPLDSGSVTYQAELVPALLSIRGGGAAITRLKRSIGRVFLTPVTGDTAETVETIISNDDGTTQVVTERSVYTLRAEETLAEQVILGAALPEGTFLANTVRLYLGLDPNRFAQRNDLELTTFLTDIDALPLGSGFISENRTSTGLALRWAATEIRSAGLDANGHPKLYFDVGAGEDYWPAVWAECESRSVDLAAILAEYLYSSTFESGAVVGSINPMRFFMENCLNSNTSALVVDFTAIPDYIKSLNLLRQLNAAVPANSVILMVAKYTVLEDDKNLGPDAVDAVEVADGKAVEETAGEVGSLDYKDHGVRYKWITRSTTCDSRMI